MPHPLTPREKLLIKVAIASTLKALANVNDAARDQMNYYREKNADRPDKEGYYDTHRQFTQLGYALEQEVEHRTMYDDDLCDDCWLIA